MASRDYRDLIAWQKSMDLVVQSYKAARCLPKEEIYALSAQLRRAAVSVPSNIAEGQGRGSDAEFVRFLRIAHGSPRELETQFIIAERLDYLSSEAVESLLRMAAEVGRLINGLIRSKGARS